MRNDLTVITTASHIKQTREQLHGLQLNIRKRKLRQGYQNTKSYEKNHANISLIFFVTLLVFRNLGFIHL